jgi:hypothetical protein
MKKKASQSDTVNQTKKDNYKETSHANNKTGKQK